MYVIGEPALAVQREGQQGVIWRLFEVYTDAEKSEKNGFCSHITTDRS
jgi:hypothetical protein